MVKTNKAQLMHLLERKATSSRLTVMPGQSSLMMHAKRSNYVAYIWKQAHVAYPIISSPVGLGWKFDKDGSLYIEW